LTASIGDDPDEVAMYKRASGHPCGIEIIRCQEAPLKQCLLDHFAELSAKCKCFVHQMEGSERVQKNLPVSGKAAPVPLVHIVRHSAEDLSTGMVFEEDVGPRPPVEMPDGHGAPCLFMMTASLIFFVLIIRRCIVCVCGGRPANTMAIVVPPAHTRIKVDALAPLRMSDINFKSNVVSK